MLKPDYELVNEHTEAKPQWAQARIVTRRGGALILDNTVYAIQPGAEDEPTRFLFRDAEEQEQELKNFFILGALRYYLRNEGRILAQRAGTQSKPAGA